MDDNERDGFKELSVVLEARAVDFLGTLSVIAQQAPLFEQKWKSTDPKRVQMNKLMTELISKVDKTNSLADKVMTLIYTGDPNATANYLPPDGERPDPATK